MREWRGGGGVLNPDRNGSEGDCDELRVLEFGYLMSRNSLWIQDMHNFRDLSGFQRVSQIRVKGTLNTTSRSEFSSISS